jgi:trk system potassium uptake protein TrkH
MNFALLFSALIGRIADVKTSSVLKYYLGANLVAIILASLNLFFNGTYPTIWSSLRYSSFQILSVGTSTGFASADSSVWPWFSQLVIIFFTLQCAMAGSTSGGIKSDRMVIFFKALFRRIKQVKYPNAVIPLVVDNKKVDENSISLAILYIVIYIFFVFISASLLTLMGVDGLAAFSGSAAAMGNVGPGLSVVGSLGNYSSIPMMGKWLLGFVMLLGRLEIYGLVVFFFPSTWKLRRQ